MDKVLIVGAGKIGSLLAILLSGEKDRDVHIGDIHFSQQDSLRLASNPHIHCHTLDIRDKTAVDLLFSQHTFSAIISCLPYFCNLCVAELAHRFSCHYFDLTEDVDITEKIRQMARGKKQAFVPQCGLAPGIIGIIANTLMKKFDTLDTVKLRVGALPVTPNNIFKYALTWSTDGLINEYGNSCHALKDSKRIELQPLEGLESLSIDGLTYECFNTSGGLGDLATTYAGKVRDLTYKTIRYPGHCELMKMLMNDLKLNDDRKTLKHLLENTIPRTLHDVVIVYVSVVGKQQGVLMEECYLKKIYSGDAKGHLWGAIQLTTASSLASVVDIVLSNSQNYHGFIQQESFSQNDIMRNRFGKLYSTQG